MAGRAIHFKGPLHLCMDQGSQHLSSHPSSRYLPFMHAARGAGSVYCMRVNQIHMQQNFSYSTSTTPSLREPVAVSDAARTLTRPAVRCPDKSQCSAGKQAPRGQPGAEAPAQCALAVCRYSAGLPDGLQHLCSVPQPAVRHVPHKLQHALFGS